jgi:hypothetical protein
LVGLRRELVKLLSKGSDLGWVIRCPESITEFGLLIAELLQLHKGGVLSVSLPACFSSLRDTPYAGSDGEEEEQQGDDDQGGCQLVAIALTTAEPLESAHLLCHR